jgi:hypothetical protein
MQPESEPESDVLLGPTETRSRNVIDYAPEICRAYAVSTQSST